MYIKSQKSISTMDCLLYLKQDLPMWFRLSSQSLCLSLPSVRIAYVTMPGHQVKLTPTQ